jgi:hypothetical protein
MKLMAGKLQVAAVCAAMLNVGQTSHASAAARPPQTNAPAREIRASGNPDHREFKSHPAKEPPQNNLNNLTCPFGVWLRCSLVTGPCGHAPRERLARRQNPCVILFKLFLRRLLMLQPVESA